MLDRKHKPLVRFFNELIDHGENYEKRSTKHDKLRDEYFFLKNVPSHLAHFYPAVFDFKDCGTYSSYKIEKIFTDDASSLILNHHSDSEQQIVKVLDLISSYLKVVPTITVSREELDSSILKDIFEKNLSRLKEIIALNHTEDFDEICKHYGFDSIQHYCLVLNNNLKLKFEQYDDQKLFYSHGDLCLSNILPIDDKVFFVDPKGYHGDIRNTYRVIHYDLAKLSHSLFGNYDRINHHLFMIKDNVIVFNEPPSEYKNLKNEFKNLLNAHNVDYNTVRLIEASLFLSLIPYHQESKLKIKAFLINSLNIFKDHY